MAWPLDEDVTNEELRGLLFPNRYAGEAKYAAPDYACIHRELTKPGVNLTLLWTEYCKQCEAANTTPYMYTQFCEKYRRWTRITKATMRIQHNLKTGVKKNTRYEMELNRSYQELAEHYDTAIVPARVEHPKDKALAKGTVKFASTWILAALQERKFFSVQEAQDAAAEKLEELNSRPFRKRGGSRRSAYLEEEREFMKPPASSSL